MKPAFQVGLGIFAALLAMEAALQVTDRNSYSQFVNDPESGLLTFLPNTQITVSGACYENTIRTNSLGLYAPEYKREKGADVFRIAVIGSSFVEAVQVPAEQNFTRLLQEKLNAMGSTTTYEVMPFAFSGNGTYLDLLYFLHDATAYRPDVFIDVTTDFYLDKNRGSATYPPRFDAQGNLVLSLPTSARSGFTVQAKNILRTSKLAMNLAKKMLLLASVTAVQPGNDAAATTSTHAAEDVWGMEEKILETFQAKSTENHARFMLMSWVSDLADMAGHTDFGTRLTALAKKHDFPYLDLQPILLAREAKEGQKPILACDGHWNDTGHRWTAEALFAFLQAHPELLRRP